MKRAKKHRKRKLNTPFSIYKCLTVIQLKRRIEREALYQNSSFDLKEAGSLVGWSHQYLSTQFNRYSQVNFSEYLNDLRATKAMKLLSDPQYSSYHVISIGLECGFSSKSTFYKAFKAKTGYSPLQYQRKNFS